MHRIVLATTNSGKLKEIQPFLSNYQIQLRSFEPVEETGLPFVENAILKARHAAQITGLPALADDSGLVVDALDGAPGIYSARYAGENVSAESHIQKLLKALENETHRNAHFYCVLVYLTHPRDPAPIISQGIWEGTILVDKQGENGFGYDPIFYVPTHHCSAAELSSEEKNRISHRGQALKILCKQL